MSENFRSWSELNTRDRVIVSMAIIAGGGFVMFLAGYETIGLTAIYSAFGIDVVLLCYRLVQGIKRRKGDEDDQTRAS